MKLRSHLVLVVLAVLAPLTAFAVTVIVLLVGYEQRAVEAGLVDTARALSVATDAELQGSIRMLEALATSDHLDSSLEAFYRDCERIRATHPGWLNVVLLRPSGEVIFNLLWPFGTSLTPTGAPELVRRIVETERPAVSDLFQGHVGQPIVGVGVPVLRAGRVKYVLVAGLHPHTLAAILTREKIPPTWTGDIVDRKHVVVARTRRAEQYIGTRADETFIDRTTESEHGAYRGLSRDGTPAYIAFSRSPVSGWTVALATPAADIESSVWYVIDAVGGGGLALGLLGIGAAALFGARVGRAIRALAAAADALGRGEVRRPRPSVVDEVDLVASAIADAGAERARAEATLRERDRELASLSHGLLQVQEQERYHLARELHDEIGQQLTALKLQLEGANGDPVRAALGQIDDLNTRVREMALNLRPPMLDHLGLLPTLEWHLERYTAQTRIRANFRSKGLEGRRFPPEVEIVVYRVVQEALTNVARHARADEATVWVAADQEHIRAGIEDRGTGFDVAAALAALTSGGLLGMRERVGLLGGSLTIESEPGAGTRILAELPLDGLAERHRAGESP